MNYPRLSTRLYNCPLLIEPGKAEVIEAVFRAYAEGRPDTLPKYEAKPQGAAPVSLEPTDNGYTLAAGGVAVLPVHGTLVQRAGGMDALSGLTGYNQIGQQLQAAMDDPKVRGVVLEFDSPGGEVAGVFELADQIMAATKPVYAHANEMAFSAGYLLASSAEQIWMPSTGMVGSVGVLLLHVDQSQSDAKRGLVYTPIYAGARKVDFSSHAALSDTAAALMQDRADQIYELFTNHVATARGISPNAVKGTEAGLLTPGQALDLGMADGQASLAETIHRMQDSFSLPFTGYSRPSRASSERSSTMSTTDKTPGQVAATEEQLNAARAEGRAAAEAETAKKVADAQAEATKTASAAAQTRIAGILGHAEADGRRKLAEHLAFKTGSTVEEAAAMLAVAPKESAAAPTNLLAAAMAKIDNPKVGLDAGDGTETEAQFAAKVVALHNRNVGRVAKK